MSDKKIFFSSDLVNDDQIGLFDRIINIKFTRENGETITVRSDYEEVWNGDTLYFKTCSPKPEIRVQYIQYQRTLINVDIYITNFNILESDGKPASEFASIDALKGAIGQKVKSGTTNLPNESYSYSGNRIIRADIEMGYRGQFFNWAKNWNRNTFPQPDAYKAFKNLEIPNDADKSQLGKAIERAFKGEVDTQLMFREMRRASIIIEWVIPISNPPDRITQFHGYVGSVDAGFQPFALLSMDCATESGVMGKIFKDDLIKGVDDEYSNIDDVSITNKEVWEGIDTSLFGQFNRSYTKEVDGEKEIVTSDTVFRNFFNGGNGFTFLEAYCFNFVTRRFPKANIPLVRNRDIEKAVLDFYIAAQIQQKSNLQAAIDSVKDSITQDVYRTAFSYNNEYFNINSQGKYEPVTSPGNGKVIPPDRDKKVWQEQINDLLVEHYVGVRYVIEDLPTYRNLYDDIRNTLKKAHDNKKRMSWWTAAAQIASKPLRYSTPIETIIEISKKELYDYVAGTENAKEKWGTAKNPKDVYVKDIRIPGSIFSGMWIVPTQRIKGSIYLKDADGKNIQMSIPQKANAAGNGYTGKNPLSPIKVFAGMFEVRDAYMFGVPVLCSRGASKHFAERIKGSDHIPIQFIPELGNQMKWICDTWGLAYYKLHQGGFFVYLPSESARQIAAELFITDQSRAPFRIPAIYDVTLSPVRVLRMPFVGFLDPMTLVEWNCKIVIGQMVSFYYQPERGRNFFTVISCTVDFSTTDEHNTEELQLVDTQYVDPKETHDRVTASTKKSTYIDVIIIPDGRMDTWRKIYNSRACVIPPTFIQVHFAKETDLPLTSDGRINPINYFTIMKEFNETLFKEAARTPENIAKFKDWWSRIDGTANRLYKPADEQVQNFPEISYVINNLPASLRRIYLRFPLMPTKAAYDDKWVNENDKVVLVWLEGTWEVFNKTDFAEFQIEAV